MSGIIDFLYKWVATMVNNILSALPTSPFQNFIDSWVAPEYLGWLNWFIPVSQILTILTAWLASIAIFYLFSVIMRWTNLIGD